MTSADDASTVVVLTTLPDETSASGLAARLVEERLIACANVVAGVTSVYRWDGEVKRDPEVLVVAKTTAQAASTVQARIAELHPYEVPEVLVLPVHGGYRPYLEWVAAEVSA